MLSKFSTEYIIKEELWAPFTDLRSKELGLITSMREVDLTNSLRITDSVKQ